MAYDYHAFCRELLRTALADARDKPFASELKVKDFSVTKCSMGGYEVERPGGFYHYANGANCVAGARAEAIDHFVDERDAPR